MWGVLIMKVFNDIAVAAGSILLPNDKIDMKKWAVIACDQYTSEPDYWKEVEKYVGDSPSALNLILPEAYLGEGESKTASRLQGIGATAHDYLDNGVWNSTVEGFIAVDRSTSIHPSRKGLIVSVDLEQYSYDTGNKERIRATEGTVVSRIPPRVKIRASSPVELPHVMLLIDDPDRTVTEKAWESVSASGETPAYDTDLFGKSGHIKGYFIENGTPIFADVIEAFRALLKKSADGMLFAVGDGNHSLASAKAHWDNIKQALTEDQRRIHPARFALAEVVNIHDAGLDFEPIHRVVFAINGNSLLDKAKEFFGSNGFSYEEADSNAQFPEDGLQHFKLICSGQKDLLCTIKKPLHTLSIGSVQMLLDNIIADSQGRVSVDYIHGEDSVRHLADSNNCGILLPNISKNSFFTTIEKDGVFPRKTFSMGEAFEKRFYIEAKRID